MFSLRRTVQSWRRRQLLSRYPINDDLWSEVTQQVSVLAELDQDELQRLRELTVLFLHRKRFFGTFEMQINDYVRVVVASQACLLVLNLNGAIESDVYPGWQSIILYPGAFVARHDYRDDIGVVHQQVMALEGEASNHGPLVLSWEDARPDATAPREDRNVVLHEFAHKLDFLDGTGNGHPPLHGNMSTKTWSETFQAAFDDLKHLVDKHHRTPFNPYAATNPAEFFAVMTEVFFQLPHRLQHEYPDVYQQLSLYYRQDPASRRA